VTEQIWWAISAGLYCLIRHHKGIRKKRRICKQVKIISKKLVYFITVTRMHT